MNIPFGDVAAQAQAAAEADQRLPGPISGRVWLYNPPTTEAEAWLFAEDCAHQACSRLTALAGGNNRYERTPLGFAIFSDDLYLLTIAAKRP